MKLPFDQAAAAILERAKLQPVLLDVGASGDPPEVWRPFAHCSTFVGFDPDLREMRETTNGPYRRSILVNCAVIADPAQREAKVFLTRSPYCSSTLEPDLPALQDYIFADLFEVERETKVAAETINSVVARLKLDRLDWIKIDTQGTDLRVFRSIDPTLRSKILAVDIEPGLIEAYKGEDTFLTAHAALIEDGFWVSDLNVLGTVRMRPDTLKKFAHLNRFYRYDRLVYRVKNNPGWVNARYLRTPKWLIDNKLGKEAWVMLFAFSLMDKSLGFALDLVVQYEKTFGSDSNLEHMRETGLQLLEQATRRTFPEVVRLSLRKIFPFLR
jgi:FkbM family methyltransferase